TAAGNQVAALAVDIALAGGQRDRRGAAIDGADSQATPRAEGNATRSGHAGGDQVVGLVDGDAAGGTAIIDTGDGGQRRGALALRRGGDRADVADGAVGIQGRVDDIGQRAADD